MTSGLAGADADANHVGAGGTARLTAGTLIAPAINLTKNDGSLDFTVTDALVWTGGGAFKVTGSGATIAINSLTIDGGTVNSDNYANLINTNSYYTGATSTLDITLGSSGATFDASGGVQSVNRALIGGGGLTKTGTGTLTLTGTNTYAGGTTISEGTLQVGDGGASGSVAGDIVNNAALVFNRSDDLTHAGSISGRGALTKTGAGTLTLTGNNTYAGGTIISEGTLQIGDGGASGSVAGDIVNNAALVFNRSDDLTHAGSISGRGALTKTGAGTLTLTGNNTYAGGTIISEGTLQIGDGGASGSIAGDIAIAKDAALTFNRSDALTYGGTISGGGSLTKDGAGTLTLAGSNAYTGMTTVQRGTLALGGALASRQLTLYGGAAFERNGQAHRLDGGVLNVNAANAQSAVYRGDLSAKNATLRFISANPPPENFSLLKIEGDADISGSAYHVGLTGDAALPTGSQLTLIEVAPGHTLTADDLQKGSVGEITIGSTIVQGIDINTTVVDRKLIGSMQAARADERAKALPEGYLGGMVLVLQGADLAADHGVDAAVRAAQGGKTGGFVTFGGGSVKYRTGSHVDANVFSLLAGLARGADLQPGRLTTGFFFEHGNGSYDTYNSFANAASVRGGGDTHYTGGGLLGRMDSEHEGQGRFYAEASTRLGRLKNDYTALDLLDAADRAAAYDSSALYYGLHLGTGYVRDLEDGASLELYGKYFWTRQEGDSLRLSSGESVRFDDVDSSRLRLGLRYARALNERTRIYAGAAWEHEFDGKARSATNGYAIDAPSLKGDTGIGELGLSFSPSKKVPLTLDLSVQGHAGRRKGVTGNIQISLSF